MLEVVTPGLLSTIQDAGRPDAASLGVPRGGACDPWSLAIANLLHGNRPDAAALEITLAGPEFVVRETCTVALAGADLGAVSIDDRRALPPGMVHLVWAGARLLFERRSDSGSNAGARAYLSLAAGVDVPEVLGSASTCLAGAFGGIEGRALEPGDLLRPVRADDLTAAGRAWPVTAAIAPEHVAPIRVVPGPHVDRFRRGALRALTSSRWLVEPESDRMGARLSGPELPARSGAEVMISVPMIWGAVQVPADGRPIILLADHQTVGGYPVIAVVIQADRPRIGQLAPWTSVRFEQVSVEAAQQAYREQQAELRRAARDLATGGAWDTAWLEAGG